MTTYQNLASCKPIGQGMHLLWVEGVCHWPKGNTCLYRGGIDFFILDKVSLKAYTSFTVQPIALRD